MLIHSSLIRNLIFLYNDYSIELKLYTSIDHNDEVYRYSRVPSLAIYFLQLNNYSIIIYYLFLVRYDKLYYFDLITYL